MQDAPKLVFQVHRHRLMYILSGITANSPRIPSVCYASDGTVDQASRYAMQFDLPLSLLICRERAQSVGAQVLSVLGDGNCLARAFSVVLYGHEDAHSSLRGLYTGFILGNPELQSFVPGFTARQYLLSNIVPGTYAGNVELEALGRATGMTIFLLTDHPTRPVFEVCNNGMGACCLSYRSGNHYDVVGIPVAAITAGSVRAPTLPPNSVLPPTPPIPPPLPSPPPAHTGASDKRVRNEDDEDI